MYCRYAYPILYIFASSCLIRVEEAANVLCMFTSSGRSQVVVFMAVANTLIERDHNVTVITTIPIPPEAISKKPFRHILLEQPRETMMKLYDAIAEMCEEWTSKIRSMNNFMVITSMFPSIQRDALSQTEFKEFLEEDNHFDLMLLGYFNNDFVVGVAGRYRCPIAVISLGSPYGPISRMVGNPEETSYVQFPLFGRSQPMCFVERLVNFLWAAVEPILYAYTNWMMEEFYKSLFPADFYPPYADVISNISLVLCNCHFSELPIRPLVPAVVEIGGIQCKEQSDPLPEDIKDFLDASLNGTIVFNVASKARRSVLKPEARNLILSVLSDLDQRVLWVWEEDEPPPNISNILFRRSLPIEDILFHRNVALFITDGRHSALSSARYRGVPMIGMPLFAEEPYNVEELVSKGFGLSVDVRNFTASTLKTVIAKVLEDPHYLERVKQFSKLFRDRPTTAKETAAFWLEYVIRHRGAAHMQSPLVHMDFVQRWNIDVIAVLLVTLYAFKKLAKLVVIIARKCLEFRTELYWRPGKYKCG